MAGWSLVGISYLYGLMKRPSVNTANRVLSLPSGTLGRAISVGLNNAFIAATPTVICGAALGILGWLSR